MCNCEVEDAREKFGIECDMTEEEVKRIDRICAQTPLLAN